MKKLMKRALLLSVLLVSLLALSVIGASAAGVTEKVDGTTYVASITVDDVTYYYETLADAVASVADGGSARIQLLEQVTGTGTLFEIANRDITLVGRDATVNDTDYDIVHTGTTFMSVIYNVGKLTFENMNVSSTATVVRLSDSAEAVASVPTAADRDATISFVNSYVHTTVSTRDNSAVVATHRHHANGQSETVTINVDASSSVGFTYTGSSAPTGGPAVFTLWHNTFPQVVVNVEGEVSLSVTNANVSAGYIVGVNNPKKATVTFGTNSQINVDVATTAVSHSVCVLYTTTGSGHTLTLPYSALVDDQGAATVDKLHLDGGIATTTTLTGTPNFADDTIPSALGLVRLGDTPGGAYGTVYFNRIADAVAQIAEGGSGNIYVLANGHVDETNVSIVGKKVTILSADSGQYSLRSTASSRAFDLGANSHLVIGKLTVTVTYAFAYNACTTASTTVKLDLESGADVHITRYSDANGYFYATATPGAANATVLTMNIKQGSSITMKSNLAASKGLSAAHNGLFRLDENHASGSTIHIAGKITYGLVWKTGLAASASRSPMFKVNGGATRLHLYIDPTAELTMAHTNAGADVWNSFICMNTNYAITINGGTFNSCTNVALVGINRTAKGSHVTVKGNPTLNSFSTGYLIYDIVTTSATTNLVWLTVENVTVPDGFTLAKNHPYTNLTMKDVRFSTQELAVTSYARIRVDSTNPSTYYTAGAFAAAVTNAPADGNPTNIYILEGATATFSGELFINPNQHIILNGSYDGESTTVDISSTGVFAMIRNSTLILKNVRYETTYRLFAISDGIREYDEETKTYSCEADAAAGTEIKLQLVNSYAGTTGTIGIYVRSYMAGATLTIDVDEGSTISLNNAAPNYMFACINGGSQEVAVGSKMSIAGKFVYQTTATATQNIMQTRAANLAIEFAPTVQFDIACGGNYNVVSVDKRADTDQFSLILGIEKPTYSLYTTTVGTTVVRSYLSDPVAVSWGEFYRVGDVTEGAQNAVYFVSLVDALQVASNDAANVHLIASTATYADDDEAKAADMQFRVGDEGGVFGWVYFTDFESAAALADAMGIDVEYINALPSIEAAISAGAVVRLGDPVDIGYMDIHYFMSIADAIDAAPADGTAIIYVLTPITTTGTAGVISGKTIVLVGLDETVDDGNYDLIHNATAPMFVLDTLGSLTLRNLAISTQGSVMATKQSKTAAEVPGASRIMAFSLERTHVDSSAIYFVHGITPHGVNSGTHGEQAAPVQSLTINVDANSKVAIETALVASPADSITAYDKHNVFIIITRAHYKLVTVNVDGEMSYHSTATEGLGSLYFVCSNNPEKFVVNVNPGAKISMRSDMTPATGTAFFYASASWSLHVMNLYLEALLDENGALAIQMPFDTTQCVYNFYASAANEDTDAAAVAIGAPIRVDLSPVRYYLPTQLVAAIGSVPTDGTQTTVAVLAPITMSNAVTLQQGQNVLLCGPDDGELDTVDITSTTRFVMVRNTKLIFKNIHLATTYNLVAISDGFYDGDDPAIAAGTEIRVELQNAHLHSSGTLGIYVRNNMLGGDVVIRIDETSTLSQENGGPSSILQMYQSDCGENSQLIIEGTVSVHTTSTGTTSAIVVNNGGKVKTTLAATATIDCQQTTHFINYEDNCTGTNSLTIGLQNPGFALYRVGENAVVVPTYLSDAVAVSYGMLYRVGEVTEGAKGEVYFGSLVDTLAATNQELSDVILLVNQSYDNDAAAKAGGMQFRVEDAEGGAFGWVYFTDLAEATAMATVKQMDVIYINMIPTVQDAIKAGAIVRLGAAVAEGYLDIHYFTTIEAAIEAALAAGSTNIELYLLASDYTVADSITLTGITLTLDTAEGLERQTVVMDGEPAFELDDGAVLVLKNAKIVATKSFALVTNPNEASSVEIDMRSGAWVEITNYQNSNSSGYFLKVKDHVPTGIITVTVGEGATIRCVSDGTQTKSNTQGLFQFRRSTQTVDGKSVTTNWCADGSSITVSGSIYFGLDYSATGQAPIFMMGNANLDLHFTPTAYVAMIHKNSTESVWNSMVVYESTFTLTINGGTFIAYDAEDETVGTEVALIGFNGNSYASNITIDGNPTLQFRSGYVINDYISASSNGGKNTSTLTIKNTTIPTAKLSLNQALTKVTLVNVNFTAGEELALIANAKIRVGDTEGVGYYSYLADAVAGAQNDQKVYVYGAQTISADTTIAPAAGVTGVVVVNQTGSYLLTVTAGTLTFYGVEVQTTGSFVKISGTASLVLGTAEGSAATKIGGDPSANALVYVSAALTGNVTVHPDVELYYNGGNFATSGARMIYLAGAVSGTMTMNGTMKAGTAQSTLYTAGASTDLICVAGALTKLVVGGDITAYMHHAANGSSVIRVTAAVSDKVVITGSVKYVLAAGSVDYTNVLYVNSTITNGIEITGADLEIDYEPANKIYNALIYLTAVKNNVTVTNNATLAVRNSLGNTVTGLSVFYNAKSGSVITVRDSAIINDTVGGTSGKLYTADATPTIKLYNVSTTGHDMAVALGMYFSNTDSEGYGYYSSLTYLLEDIAEGEEGTAYVIADGLTVSSSEYKITGKTLRLTSANEDEDPYTLTFNNTSLGTAVPFKLYDGGGLILDYIEIIAKQRFLRFETNTSENASSFVMESGAVLRAVPDANAAKVTDGAFIFNPVCSGKILVNIKSGATMIRESWGEGVDKTSQLINLNNDSADISGTIRIAGTIINNATFSATDKACEISLVRCGAPNVAVTIKSTARLIASTSNVYNTGSTHAALVAAAGDLTIEGGGTEEEPQFQTTGTNAPSVVCFFTGNTSSLTIIGTPVVDLAEATENHYSNYFVNDPVVSKFVAVDNDAVAAEWLGAVYRVSSYEPYENEEVGKLGVIYFYSIVDAYAASKAGTAGTFEDLALILPETDYFASDDEAKENGMEYRVGDTTEGNHLLVYFAYDEREEAEALAEWSNMTLAFINMFTTVEQAIEQGAVVRIGAAVEGRLDLNYFTSIEAALNYALENSQTDIVLYLLVDGQTVGSTVSIEGYKLTIDSAESLGRLSMTMTATPAFKMLNNSHLVIKNVRVVATKAFVIVDNTDTTSYAKLDFESGAECEVTNYTTSSTSYFMKLAVSANTGVLTMNVKNGATLKLYNADTNVVIGETQGMFQLRNGNKYACADNSVINVDGTIIYGLVFNPALPDGQRRSPLFMHSDDTLDLYFTSNANVQLLHTNAAESTWNAIVCAESKGIVSIDGGTYTTAEHCGIIGFNGDVIRGTYTVQNNPTLNLASGWLFNDHCVTDAETGEITLYNTTVVTLENVNFGEYNVCLHGSMTKLVMKNVSFVNRAKAVANDCAWRIGNSETSGYYNHLGYAAIAANGGTVYQIANYTTRSNYELTDTSFTLACPAGERYTLTSHLGGGNSAFLLVLKGSCNVTLQNIDINGKGRTFSFSNSVTAGSPAGLTLINAAVYGVAHGTNANAMLSVSGTGTQYFNLLIDKDSEMGYRDGNPADIKSTRDYQVIFYNASVTGDIFIHGSVYAYVYFGNINYAKIPDAWTSYGPNDQHMISIGNTTSHLFTGDFVITGSVKLKAVYPSVDENGDPVTIDKLADYHKAYAVYVYGNNANVFVAQGASVSAELTNALATASGRFGFSAGGVEQLTTTYTQNGNNLSGVCYYAGLSGIVRFLNENAFAGKQITIAQTSGSSNYVFVYDANIIVSFDDTVHTTLATNEETFEYIYAKSTSELLNTLYGTTISFRDDQVTTAYEFIVGKVDRSEVSGYLAQLDGSDYALIVKSNKVYLLSMSEAGLDLGAKQLQLLINQMAAAGKDFTLPNDITLICKASASWVSDFTRPTNVTLSGGQYLNNSAFQYLYTGTGATVANYTTYCNTLVSEGYALVWENSIGQNRFRMYQHEQKAISLYVAYYDYTYEETFNTLYDEELSDMTSSNPSATFDDSHVQRDYQKCIRIVATPMSAQTGPDAGVLTPLAQQSYEKVTDTMMTMLSFQSGAVGMGYVFMLEDGRFVVIDGGNINSEGVNASGITEDEMIWNVMVEMYKKVYKTEPTEEKPIHVAAWYLTHAHSDHWAAYRKMVLNHGAEMKMDYMIANIGTANSFTRIGSTTFSYVSAMQAAVNGGFKLIMPYAGQRIYLANLEIEILMTYADHLPDRIINTNDSNSIPRFHIHNSEAISTVSPTSILFPGDAWRLQSRFMCAMYGEYLQSDIVQVAHHGNIGVERAFYKQVMPTGVFFPNNGSTMQSYCYWNTNLKDAGNSYAYVADKYIVKECETVRYVITANYPNTGTYGGEYNMLVFTPAGPDYKGVCDLFTGTAIAYGTNANKDIHVAKGTDVISLNVGWGSLSFTYQGSQGTWNPETHEYEGATEGGWVADGDCYVIVENAGDITVGVTVTYTQASGYTDLVGSFTENGVAVTPSTEFTLERLKRREFAFNITSNEAPTAAMNDATIGTITVKVTRSIS